MHLLFAGTFIRICRYYHQNLLQVITSDLEGKNSIFFRRSFFPRYALGMPSFNNSVRIVGDMLVDILYLITTKVTHFGCLLYLPLYSKQFSNGKNKRNVND